MLDSTKNFFWQSRSRLNKGLSACRDGFTIVELTIAIVILSVLLVSLLGISTYYFAQITRNNTLVEMTADSQNLLRSTVEELRYGAGVRQSNTIADANAPAGGWNTSNTTFVIIIAVPATNATSNYIINPDTGDPYLNELVYFKSGNTLYKRTLAQPDAVGNKLLTSCPENLATQSCPADRKLIENLNSMVFLLYDQDNNTTNDPLLARSVKIDLALQKDTFGSPLTFDNSISVTLRNTFQ